MNPCVGACGRNAKCDVINHKPFCTCNNGFKGNPFANCEREMFDIQPVQINPCSPSPCGSNSICREVNNQATCSCASEMIGSPPNCRPECISNSECSSNLACMNNKCQNPCQGVCAINAECKVVSHTPMCACLNNLIGDPLVQCYEKQQDYPIQTSTPCSPSPCGANAKCREQNNAGACFCDPDYVGDPYQGCRPECILNSDCPSNLACLNNKCKDPCPGTCAQNAICQVINHNAMCTCNIGFSGDGYRYCSIQRDERKIPIFLKSISSTNKLLLTPFINKSNKLNNSLSFIIAIIQPYKNPCSPSPCGLNSRCKENNGQAICSCENNYIGAPPNCRPECVTNSDCSLDKACVGQKCSDPCLNSCGNDASCKVINHSPICSCSYPLTGDPFVRCYKQPSKTPNISLSIPKTSLKNTFICY